MAGWTGRGSPEQFSEDHANLFTKVRTGEISSNFIYIIQEMYDITAATKMNATQFYNAAIGSGQPPVLRRAVVDALRLCYQIQEYPARKRIELQQDRIWLGVQMNARPLTERVHWRHVRSGSYNTGIYTWIVRYAANLLLQTPTVLNVYQQNEKPYIVAYTDQINPPVLLVAFPGMEFCLADIITIAKFFKAQAEDHGNVSEGISAGAGFTDGAQSAIDNGLFVTIDQILVQEGKNKDQIQTVFCGHSLGGAVASICTLKYVQQFFADRNPMNHQVLLITLGQPKTIKKGSEDRFTHVVGTHNYLRLVAVNREKTTTDCVTGYRQIKDEDPDSFGCCHSVNAHYVDTGIALENRNFFGKAYKKWSGKEWLGLLERAVLHPLSAYEQGMQENPGDPHLLTLHENNTRPPTPERGTHITEERVRALIHAAQDQMNALLGRQLDQLGRRITNLEQEALNTRIGELVEQAMAGAFMQLRVEMQAIATENRNISNRLEDLITRMGRVPQPTPPPTPTDSSALAMAFGAAEWRRYFGDVGVEPPLPANINAILNGPCPIWPGRRVYETHSLTLIPASVCGRPLTLDYFFKLCKQSQGGGYAMENASVVSPYAAEIITAPESVSYWVLTTRDVIPATLPAQPPGYGQGMDGSNPRWDEYMGTINAYNRKVYEAYQSSLAKCVGYRLPHAIEAVFVVATQYVKTGTCTRLVPCLEKRSGNFPGVYNGRGADYGQQHHIAINTCGDSLKCSLMGVGGPIIALRRL